jgi:nicotinamidase-related amidase
MTTALLLIDMQNWILHGKGSPVRQPIIDRALDDLVTRLARLQRVAREAKVPVIMVQHDGPADYRLATGTDGWNFRSELAPIAGDIVVHKQSCDSFHDTDLQPRLRDLRITHLVIGGCMTQFCVDTTCRRAVSMGYDVTLLGDGHMTADMGDLRFEQIIAHHNAVLDGFDAGKHAIRIATTVAIAF